jgi:hypothetical protein
MNSNRESTESEGKTSNGYIPNKSLVKFLEEKLHYEKQRKLKLAGERLSRNEEKKGQELKRMKNYILNKHIFQSMANLVTFFEYISKNQELQKVFDDDIYELLLGGNVNSSDNLVVYRRLVESTIRWDWKNNPHNFRLTLLYTLQNIIFQNFPFIINSVMMEETYSSEMGNVVRQDLSRAYLWAKILASKVEYQEAYKFRRPVSF